MSRSREKGSKWFVDRLSRDEEHSHRIKKTVVNTRTEHQALAILDLYSFGKSLVLDGDLQSAEADEFIYHEALVHPGMVLHGSPKKVLILGGGEGATLREVVKWKTVSKAVMVDIDPQVVKFSRKFLPSYSSGAFESKKARIVFKDAREYVDEIDEQFDMIIADLPSPIEGGPACLLYTKEFFQKLRRIIHKKGILVVQCDSFCMTEVHVGARLAWTLRRVFPFVYPYAAYVPSYQCLWGFVIASLSDVARSVSTKQIGERIQKSVGSKRLRFYDATTHSRLFNLPKYLRKALRSRKRLVTDRNPVFVYDGRKKP